MKGRIMERQIVEQWLNNLKNYWYNKDIKNAVSLFEKTSFYQETPFMEHYKSIVEIND